MFVFLPPYENSHLVYRSTLLALKEWGHRTYTLPINNIPGLWLQMESERYLRTLLGFLLLKLLVTGKPGVARSLSIK